MHCLPGSRMARISFPSRKEGDMQLAVCCKVWSSCQQSQRLLYVERSSIRCFPCLLFPAPLPEFLCVFLSAHHRSDRVLLSVRFRLARSSTYLQQETTL